MTRSKSFVLVGLLVLLFLTAQIFTAAQFEVESPAHNSIVQAKPTIDPFPRPTDYRLIIAEQVFENGRMFYIDIVERIWVLYEEEDKMGGKWEVYEDSWQEGDPEFDENIIAPDGLHQPVRGFGIIWRENRKVRNALGWALDPEIGHLSQYNYYDRNVDEDNEEAEGAPGWYTLVSYYGRRFAFDELNMTWELLRVPDDGSDESDDSENEE